VAKPESFHYLVVNSELLDCMLVSLIVSLFFYDMVLKQRSRS